MDPIAILNAVAAFAAAGATFGSWRAAHQSKQTSTTVAAIEKRREHADLTPRLDITCAALYGDRAELRVRFTGPDALKKLKIRIEIRDDWPDRTSVLTKGPTDEEIAQYIWGPYRFLKGIDHEGASQRNIPEVALLNGDFRPLALQRTVQPPWSTGQWWEDNYRGMPVRLALHCEHEGFEPWTLHRDVQVEPYKEQQAQLLA